MGKEKVELPDMSNPDVARAFYEMLNQANIDTLNMRTNAAAKKKPAAKKAPAKKK